MTFICYPVTALVGELGGKNILMAKLAGWLLFWHHLHRRNTNIKNRKYKYKYKYKKYCDDQISWMTAPLTPPAVPTMLKQTDAAGHFRVGHKLFNAVIFCLVSGLCIFVLYYQVFLFLCLLDSSLDSFGHFWTLWTLWTHLDSFGHFSRLLPLVISFYFYFWF